MYARDRDAKFVRRQARANLVEAQLTFLVKLMGLRPSPAGKGTWLNPQTNAWVQISKLPSGGTPKFKGYAVKPRVVINFQRGNPFEIRLSEDGDPSEAFVRRVAHRLGLDPKIPAEAYVEVLDHVQDLTIDPREIRAEETWDLSTDALSVLKTVQST